MRPGPSGSRAAAGLLLCLDTVDLQGANAGAVTGPAWRPGAAALLAHARAHAWPIAHVLTNRPRPGGSGWRPAPGLAPLPSEPVFHRHTQSAFGAAGFRDFARAPAARRLVVVGRSSDGACLATTLDAVEAQLRILLPMDAIGLPERERSGLQAMAVIGGRMPRMRVTLCTAEQLLGGAPEVRVIRGGRG